MELNPNNAYLVSTGAFLLGLIGEWEVSLEALERMKPLNPFGPGWLRLVPFLADLRAGKYDEALIEAHRFNTPNLDLDSIPRASAAGYVGDVREATSALIDLETLFPESAETGGQVLPSLVRDAALQQAVLEGVEQARRLVGESAPAG